MSKQPELHGHERQAFGGFRDDVVYLERVNVPTYPEAREIIAAEVGDWSDLTNPKPIFMNWVTGDEAVDRMDGEFDECWMECQSEHPDAVPFWKNDP